MMNWHLSQQAIRWPVTMWPYRAPYRGLKFTAHLCHVFLWSWPLTKCWFFDWIAGSCQVNLLITGQDCSGPDSGPKVNRIITFSSKKIFFAALFCVYGDDWNSNQKAEEKFQVRILPFPRLVQSGSEQPGPGATLLGWPKSIYYVCLTVIHK